MNVSVAPQIANAVRAANTAATGGLKQFISFRIGGEEYAIDIMAVREIKGWAETTSLPNQPQHILGVMNLRGTIVPVFDLRCRFGMGLTEASRSHVVIIVSVLDRIVGLLVDAVSDILTIDSSEIRPVPEMDRGIAADFLSGIVSINEIDGRHSRTRRTVLAIRHGEAFPGFRRTAGRSMRYA